MLHFRRVLEAAVDDGAEELGLEEEVAEARGVDARVGAAPTVWGVTTDGVGGRAAWGARARARTKRERQKRGAAKEERGRGDDTGEEDERDA